MLDSCGFAGLFVSLFQLFDTDCVEFDEIVSENLTYDALVSILMYCHEVNLCCGFSLQFIFATPLGLLLRLYYSFTPTPPSQFSFKVLA